MSYHKLCQNHPEELFCIKVYQTVLCLPSHHFRKKPSQEETLEVLFLSIRALEVLFIVVIDRKTWCVTINIQRSHQRSRSRLLRQHKGQGMQQNATQRCHPGESLKLKLKADCFGASDEVTWASQTLEINSFNVTSCETLRIAESWSFLPECWHPIGRLGTPSCTLQAVLDLRKELYALLELLTCCGVLLQFAQALQTIVQTGILRTKSRLWLLVQMSNHALKEKPYKSS